MIINPLTMVVAIIAIVAIATVIRARTGNGMRGQGAALLAFTQMQEMAQMRDELAELKARVAALESARRDNGPVAS